MMPQRCSPAGSRPSRSGAGAGKRLSCLRCGPISGRRGPFPYPVWVMRPPHERRIMCRVPPRQEGGRGMSTIKVVLADDHGLMRDAVRMVLDGDPDFELIGEV